MKEVCRLSIVVAMACLVPAGARAQQPRWEIEAYGGLVAGASVSDGSRTLPPAGTPLVTSNPTFPTREVPSWFFGDGAALLNDVAEEFGGAARISPLDQQFAAMPRGRDGTAGARIRRRFPPRMSAEFGIDVFAAAAVTPAGLADTIEAARRSYTATMGELLATGPFSAVLVEAGASSNAGRRRELAVTAALNADVRRLGAFTPYATFGGGILAGTGARPSAALTGRYRFSILGEVPIEESERMALRFERPATFVVVLGGGVRRDLSEKWGLRIDVRALLGADSTRVVVDAETASVRGTPGGFVESFTNPAIQFSNDPSTGRRSTLSAPALEAFQVFSGGFQTRTVVTVGVSRRF